MIFIKKMEYKPALSKSRLYLLGSDRCRQQNSPNLLYFLKKLPCDDSIFCDYTGMQPLLTYEI